MLNLALFRALEDKNFHTKKQSYVNLSQSKSHKYLSPNAFKNSKLNKISSSQMRNKNSHLDHSPSQNNVFERLFKNKEENRLKLEALQEEYHINNSSETRKRMSRSKSKSQEKLRRNPSKSPDDFYKKQMDLKIKSDK